MNSAKRLESRLKGMVAPRGGMFVPPELTEQMIKGIRKKSSIGVTFSFEMLPTLDAKGFKDVTLIVEEQPKKYIRNLCTKYGYEVKTFEKVKGMKFDVILGNPPYQNPKSGNDNTNQGGGKKLYVQFMGKASTLINEGGIVAFVTPSAVFKTSVYGQKGTGFHSMDGCKVAFCETDANKYFSVGVSVCWWIAQKTNKNITAIVNGKKSNFNELGFCTFDSRLQSIAEKLLTNEIPISISRDKPLKGKGITTSRYAYLTFNNTPEDTNLAWEHSNPEKLKKLLQSNMFCRVAWDGFVNLDKRWYHNFWSALYVHPNLNVNMTDDDIMNLYELTEEEKTIINERDRKNIVKA